MKAKTIPTANKPGALHCAAGSIVPVHCSTSLADDDHRTADPFVSAYYSTTLADNAHQTADPFVPAYYTTALPDDDHRTGALMESGYHTALRQETLKQATLFLSTVLHFMVDLSCIFYMYAVMNPMAHTGEEWLSWAVFYNFMAFAFPALLGLLEDRFLKEKDLYFSALGCILVAFSYLLFRVPLLSIFLIGLGNGMFHLGSGKQILMDSPRYAPSGIFISSGALGVFLGTFWGGRYMPFRRLFPGLLIPGAVLMLVLAFLRSRQMKPTFENAAAEVSGKVDKSTIAAAEVSGSIDKSAIAAVEVSGNIDKSVIAAAEISENIDKSAINSSQNSPLKTDDRKKMPLRAFLIGITAIFLVVVIRSYYGTIQKFPWKSTFAAGLFFTICVAGGKACGGILADLLGLRKTVVLSLCAAAATAFFAFRYPAAGYLSIFLFNMTMPLTLVMLSDRLSGRKAFAFGFLMLALFAGTLPVMVLQIYWFCSGMGLTVLCLVSLALMLLALWEAPQDKLD